jgi:hypothetical protein
MTATSWWEYVSDAMGDMSALEAGRKAGFDASAFTRWKKGASPDVGFVVKFARAFDLNVLQALVAAEIITEDEAGTREIRVGAADALRTASAASLSDEVERRLIELEVGGATIVRGRFGNVGSRHYDERAVALESEISIEDADAEREETP